MSTTKKIKDITNLYLNNSILSLFLRIIGVFFIFLTSFLLTKSYKSETVGLYDFTRSYLLVVGALSMMSIDQSILYFLGKRKYNKSNFINFYKIIIKICCVSSLSIYILTLIFLQFFKLETNTESIIIKCNLILFFYNLYLINGEIYRAFNGIVVSELFRNVIKYIPLLLGIFLFSYFEDECYVLDFFIYGFFFTALISFLILFYYYNKLENNNKIFKEETFKSVINYTYPIAISTILLYMLNFIDITLIKYFLGDNHVAYFSLAIKIVSIFSVLINAISLSIASSIAENYTLGSTSEIQRIINKTSKLIFIVTMSLSIILYVVHEPFLSIFGEEYLISANSFKILLVGNVVFSLSGLSTIYMLMTNKGRILSLFLFLAVLINLVLNYLFIPKYGIEAAAIASIISFIFWSFISGIYILRKDNINIFLNFK